MPNATYEEGTELVLDSEAVTLGTGWTEAATGSDVVRNGSLVALALRVSNLARAAWAEKSKYALGTLVTEGGKTYVLIVKEPEAEKSKPTTDAGVHWQEVVAPARVCTLPLQYRPPVDVKNEAGTLEVKSNGEVLSSASLTEAAAHVYEVGYRAAGISP